MRESLRKTGAILSLTLVTGLGVTACDSNARDAANVVKVNTTDKGPEVSYLYYPNGTREIVTDLYAGSSPGEIGDASVNTVFEYCDGKDLVDQVENNDPVQSWDGGGFQRSVNYPACADGKLTPSDFQGK